MTNCYYIIVACYPDKGMKSYGSKGMLNFDSKKLFEHQINWIKKLHHHNEKNIYIIADFDFHKVNKLDSSINVINADGENPIIKCCREISDGHLCFIDYGCVFHQNILKKFTFDTSEILCVDDSVDHTNLDIGCTITDNIIEHMFFDLPKSKFCNIFTIHQKDREKIKNSRNFKNKNLLYFEILNTLIHEGSVVKPVFIKDKFIYFNHMRQKNAINKFIKKISN